MYSLSWTLSFESLAEQQRAVLKVLNSDYHLLFLLMNKLSSDFSIMLIKTRSRGYHCGPDMPLYDNNSSFKQLRVSF